MNLHGDYFADRKETILRGISAFPLAKSLINYIILTALTLTIFYLSLITTSMPLTAEQADQVERAIKVLEDKGFAGEVFVLRHLATIRGGGNWINSVTTYENAYAATNFPFGIVTVYPDFFHKTVDDTERAMVLLHEARHVTGGDERDAYAFVWENRDQLGWTILKYGTTASFITIEEQTREYAPDLFECPERLFGDCTIMLNNRKGSLMRAEKAVRSNAKNRAYKKRSAGVPSRADRRKISSK